MGYKIIERDPSLKPFEKYINTRMSKYKSKRKQLLRSERSLCDLANAHEYFGFHKTENGWIYREWAPAASEVFLTGDMVGWNRFALKLNALGNGVFEIFMEGRDFLYDGCHVKTVVHHEDSYLERVPLYIKRVVQDRDSGTWCGSVVDAPEYQWKSTRFLPKKKELFIYECHIGMAQQEEKVGTYREFTRNVLPRIKELGYNTVQIMAIMEHPYYGSFGYQVSSFFAASSRFGTPNELKELIDTAHSMDISVLLDVVHSHAVKNTGDGINEFDGTSYQFFHDGPKGDHPAWDTKLFDYGKNEVIHFLLSNLKFWMTEYHFDGFRFDGVTSMIYSDHGLGVSFTDYSKYFSSNTDDDAVTYLQLANELIRQVNPEAITVAEDMSAMPGMCLPIKEGGIGFDYRLAMGLPDMWIKLMKTDGDENWDMWNVWNELTCRRVGEKYVSYVESHDQALVGDKTLIFRMCDKYMYTDMSLNSKNPIIDRGISLHKMIRLLTAASGGEGYLNFMGNEFGHPEWIDFPREGNGWSHFYCRRQWNLADDGNLKYQYLKCFDKAMIALLSENGIYSKKEKCLLIDQDKKILAFERGGLVFVFNFHPENSYEGYWITLPRSGKYSVKLTTDSTDFGGYGNVSEDYVYKTQKQDDGTDRFRIYLPTRTGICLKKI